MNEMIKAERNKICSRKQTRMLFLAGVVLIVAYFFFFQFNYCLLYTSDAADE